MIARTLQAMKAMSVGPRDGAKNYNNQMNQKHLRIQKNSRTTLTSEIKTHHTERRRDIEQQEEDDEDDQSAEDIEQVQNLSGDHLNKHDSEPLLILINHSK